MPTPLRNFNWIHVYGISKVKITFKFEAHTLIHTHNLIFDVNKM